MQCWQCGATVRQGAKICIYCGAQLTDDAFNREEEYERERATYESERLPTPEYRPERQPTPQYQPGRKPAPEYQPDLQDRAGRRPEYDSPYDATPPERGIRGTPGVKQTDDADGRSREPRRLGISRLRGNTPPPPGPSPDPRSPRVRPPSEGERVRHRQDEGDGVGDYGGGPSRREEQGYSDCDEREDKRRPSRSSEREARDQSDRTRDRRGNPYSAYNDEGEVYRSDRDQVGRHGGGGGRQTYEDPSSGTRRDRYGDGGWNAQDGRRRMERAGRSEPAPPGPLEDSWGLPALTGPEARIQSGSDQWQARADPAPRWASSAGRRPNVQLRGQARATRQKRRGRFPAVALLLAGALVVITVGAVLGTGLLRRLGGSAVPGSASVFATYTPGPTPTDVPGYTEYKSAQSQFVLNYPQAWSQSNTNDTSQGTPDYLDTFAQAGASLKVERSPAFDAATDLGIIQGEVQGGQNAGLTLTETRSAAGIAVIGGEQWTRREYDVSSQGGKEHLAIFSCHHEGHGYAIVLRSPANAYAQVYSTTFKTMLGSFRFTT